MSLDFASQLVSEGAVTPALIDDALRRQVLSGGALDTILLELGALTEAECLAQLERVSGLDAAPASQLLTADPALASLLAPKLAERHALLPLRADGLELVVATSFPPNEEMLEEIGFLVGRELVPQVALEARVRQGIARLYGRPLPPRFAALVAALDSAPPPQPRPEPRPPPRPRVPEIASDEDGLTSAIERVIEQAEPEPWTEQDGAVRPVPREQPAAAAPAPEPLPEAAAWTLGQARGALERAPDRDAIVDVALRFALKTFDYACAWAVIGGHAMGWAALSRGGDPEQNVEHLSVPLDVPSVLRTVLMTRGRYLGPVPSDPTTQKLLADLGRGRPQAAFLYPVEVRDRVVAILYADVQERAASARRVGEYVVFAQAVGRRFERLLLEQKRKLPRARSAPVEPQEPASAWAGSPPREPIPLTDAISLPPYLSVPAGSLAARSDDRPVRDPAAGLDLPELETSYPLSNLERGTPSLQVQAPGASRRPFGAVAAEAAQVAMPSMTELFAAVDRLLEGDVADRARALNELVRYPEVAAAALVARFPGPLLRARLPIQELPTAEELGPIPAALVRLGPAAAQALRPLLEHPDIDIRYFAVLTAGRTPSPELLTAVGQRIFDRHPVVASAARAALVLLQELPNFEEALLRLRRSLLSPHGEVVANAARALGTLRDVGSIDELIPLTGHPDRNVAQAASEALRDITKQSFAQTRRWSGWWEENRSRPRMEWLIDALKHKDLDLRLSAIDELVRVVNDNLGYYADAPKKERDEAADRWAQWWRRRAS